MKIGCITTSTIPSTTANSIQVMKVCQAMLQLGHELILWTPGVQRREPESIKEVYGLQEEVPIQWINNISMLKRYDFIIKAVNAAKKADVDLIYTWAPQAAWLSSNQKLPTILEMHDRATGKIGPWLVGQFLLRSDRNLLVSITYALITALEKQLAIKIDPNHTVVAPNGVDIERYQNLPDPQTARKQLGIPNNVTVGYTGHFYTGRGLDILFHLAKKFWGIQFLWVGGREGELKQVRERLDKEKISNVILTGFIPNADLPRYQAASDILIMPYERSIAGSSGGNSADICSPMKMFEYMAADRPIVSSDLPVIKEVLHDEMAYYCPPEDPVAWENQIQWILDHPDASRSRGRIAFNEVAQYTVLKRQQRIMDKFEDL